MEEEIFQSKFLVWDCCRSVRNSTNFYPGRMLGGPYSGIFDILVVRSPDPNVVHSFDGRSVSGLLIRQKDNQVNDFTISDGFIAV